MVVEISFTGVIRTNCWVMDRDEGEFDVTWLLFSDIQAKNFAGLTEGLRDSHLGLQHPKARKQQRILVLFETTVLCGLVFDGRAEDSLIEKKIKR